VDDREDRELAVDVLLVVCVLDVDELEDVDVDVEVLEVVKIMTTGS